MSQTYIAAVVGLLAVILPKFGITIGSEELTTTIQSIVVTITTIWTLVRRYQLGKEIQPGGDINVAGVRKENLS